VTAAAAGKACRDAIAAELRSMINGYRIDSHRAFPFIRRRRHPPINGADALLTGELPPLSMPMGSMSRIGRIR